MRRALAHKAADCASGSLSDGARAVRHLHYEEMRWTLVQDESGRRRMVADRKVADDLSHDDGVRLFNAEYPRWMKWSGRSAVALLPVTVGLQVGLASLHPGMVFAVTVGMVGAVWFVSLNTFTIAMVARNVTGRRARSLRREWLRLGRCAWCSHALHAYKPCEEGVTTCPECEGQWRIARRAEAENSSGDVADSEAGRAMDVDDGNRADKDNCADEGRCPDADKRVDTDKCVDTDKYVDADQQVVEHHDADTRPSDRRSARQ